jgi:hypothetical protein
MQEVTVLTISGRQEAFVGDYMVFRKHRIVPMEKVLGASPAEFIDVRTVRPVRRLGRGHARFYAVMDPEVAEVARLCADQDLQDELAGVRQQLRLAQADSRAHKAAADNLRDEEARRAALPRWRRLWEALRA